MPISALQKNRVYAPVILGICVLVIAFVVRPLYAGYIDNQAEIATLTTQKADKQAKLDKIIKMQSEFSGSGSSDLTNQVKKMNKGYDASNIMYTIMINDYTKALDFSAPRINIASISLDKGAVLPSGLSLAKVSLAISAASTDDIVDYLTYLTTTQPNLAITLSDINLPLDTAPIDSAAGVSLTVNLGVYYY